MNFDEALKIEGAETYQVLNYFYCSTDTLVSTLSDIRSSFSASKYQSWALHDDEWPVGIVLLEAHLSSLEEVVLATVETSLAGMSARGVKGSICIFDGVFSGYKETLRPTNAEHIYSVWVQGGDLNLAMNDALRRSNEWKKVVDDFRATLTGA